MSRDTPRLEGFQCLSLPGKPRVTRGGCGDRFRRAQRGLETVAVEIREGFKVCRGCPIGQDHARGNLPDVSASAFQTAPAPIERPKVMPSVTRIPPSRPGAPAATAPAAPPRAPAPSPMGPEALAKPPAPAPAPVEPPKPAPVAAAGEPDMEETMAKTKNFKDKTCPCGVTFTPKTARQKYCTEVCDFRPKPTPKKKRAAKRTGGAKRKAPAATEEAPTPPAPAATGTALARRAPELDPAQVLVAAGFDVKVYNVPKGRMILVEH